MSWFEEWIGTEQVRTYTLDGDTLQLLTPAGRMPRQDGGEATVMGIMSWERESLAEDSPSLQISG